MKKILGIIVTILFVIGFSKTCLADNTKDVSADSYKYDYEDIIIKKGNKDEKIVALTFDDGPDEVFTPQVLDILKKYDVKATFFLIGEKVPYNKNIVKREKEEGHEIGNHTYTHINAAKTSKEKIENEVIKTQEVIKEVIGEYPTIFRPPYRALSKDLCQVVKSKDMNIILWSNIDVRDWSNPGVNNIVSTIENKVENGNIIILHDYNTVRNSKSQTIQALDIIIPKLKEKGYKFVTISELMNHLNK